jgi:hypothetical protein
MKTFPLVFITLLIVFSACQPDKSDNSEANSLTFTYEIDTIRIDAKGEFLFLNTDLYMSDYDPKTDHLYNINSQTSRMEVIDLGRNELKELIQYDQDGPNAIKDMFTSGIQITDSGEKWFTDYYSLIHLNAEGERVGKYRLSNEVFSGDTLARGHEIDGMGKITRSGKYFVSHYGDYQTVGEGPQGLAVIDLQSRTKRLFPLDGFKFLNKYELVYSEGDRIIKRAGEWNFISLTDQKIIHSNSAQNKLQILDLVSGVVLEVQLKSKLLTDEKPGTYPKIAHSKDQFDEFDELKNREVSFGRWVYDQDQEYFWRIARERKKETVGNPVFSMVLTVLDKEFNQISETPLKPEQALLFDRLPYLSFVRKGMLYMFLNIDDEMAFVRFKPEFAD